jgi:hypothetical protein
MQSYAFLDVESILYQLPEGYEVEAAPKPVAIEKPFATWWSTLALYEPGQLVYVRRLEMTATEIPPGMYGEYVQFLEDVAKADKANVALVRR